MTKPPRDPADDLTDDEYQAIFGWRDGEGDFDLTLYDDETDVHFLKRPSFFETLKKAISYPLLLLQRR